MDIATFVEKIQHTELESAGVMLRRLADALNGEEPWERDRILCKVMIGTGASLRECLEVAQGIDRMYGTDCIQFLRDYV